MSFTKKYLYSLSIVVLIVVVGKLLIGNSSAKQNSNFSTSSLPDVSSPTTTSAPSPSPSSSSSSTSTPSAPTSTPSSQTNSGSGKYKNGTYTGSVEDASYGNVQIKITVSSGKISNVAILQYPNENGTSARINSYALPQLQSEVIKAQSTNINAVSGASFTSQAFYQSLKTALNQAI